MCPGGNRLGAVKPQLWIIRIQIRQFARKPTLERRPILARRSVRIDEAGERVGRIEMLRRRTMKPGRCRRIARPRMMRPGMVGNKIYQHFHAQLVRIGYQRLIFGQRSHVRVNGIKVHGMIR